MPATALLIGYERNASPPRDLDADRDVYIEAEAERRANGPYDADEVDYHLDSLRGSQTEKLFAQYLNTNDAIALMQLIKATFDPRRQDYHESEVAREMRDRGL